MKKLVAWLLAVACIGGLVGCSSSGTRPYQDLTAQEVSSADKTLPVEDIGELVALLNDVVIYNKDSSYTDCAGQAVTFTLTMTDGTQTSIMAYNPFLVIDGVGYRTEYEPCEALNNYANELLNAAEANAE